MTLTTEEYYALAALARQGATTPERLRMLEAFLRLIDERNGVARNALRLRWMEADYPLPPTTNFPETWPPQLERVVEVQGRAVARADVDAALKTYARRPVGAMVTKDAGGLVGWTPVDEFFQ